MHGRTQIHQVEGAGGVREARKNEEGEGRFWVGVEDGERVLRVREIDR